MFLFLGFIHIPRDPSYHDPMNDVYRSAASVLVLQPAEDAAPRFLLLHKPRKHDAWQLPQGGVEQGETETDAALRELSEEAGIASCRVLGKSEKIYKYDFPPSFRRFRPDNVCGQRIAYVFAVTDPGTEVRVDEKEIDAFVWIAPSEISRYIHREEYAKLVRELYEEAVASFQGSLSH
jgi:putative (di)nucleoside polyphosphate hydrolase